MVIQLPQFHDLGTDSCRLLHGRGGHFPDCEHLSLDWFAPTLLVTFHAERESNELILNHLLETASSLPEISAVVVQDRHLPGSPKRVIYGALPKETHALEGGLRYQLSLERNRNHGFFLDMKPGREWVRSAAAGKRVLNLFAYTCSLSVAAIAGGAESVVNLDMASKALATGRANHQLNFNAHLCRRASYLPHDLFKTWGRLKRNAPYDLIIIDPPSNQVGSFVAEKDYAKIARRLVEVTHPRTQILACLNAPHLDESFLTELFSDYQLERRLPHAAGFEDSEPQASLKAMVFSH